MMTMILAKEFEGALWILAKDHQAALEQQAAVIELLRDALRVIRLKCDPKYGWPIIDKALDLQPCPEVLNKVRVDAVRRFGQYVGDQHTLSTVAIQEPGVVRDVAEQYAQRIEKGEA